MSVQLNHAKIFLEGIEIPFINASVTCTLNEFPMCSVTVPAVAAALNVRYRSHMMLVNWDSRYNDYVLVFEGEVQAKGYSFSVGGASVQITAKSMFSHLSNMMLMWGTTESTANNAAEMNATLRCGADELVVGVNKGNATAAASHAAYLGDLFASEGSPDIMKGLELFVRGGYLNDMTPDPKMQGAVPRFYAMKGSEAHLIPGVGKGSSRYKFDRSATADKFFETVRTKEILLDGANQTMSPRSSRWEFIRRITHLMNYDISMPLSTLAAGLIIKPNMYFCAPPACNVLFPDMLISMSYSDNMGQSPTRLLSSVTNDFFSENRSLSLDIWYPVDIGVNILDGPEKGTVDIGGKAMKEIYETAEEKEIGQTTAYGSIDNIMVMAALAAATKSDSATTSQDWMNQQVQMAREEFQKLRFGTRSGSFISVSNLNLVPGFPVMILKGGSENEHDGTVPISIIGYLTSVTHSFVPSGSSTTNGQFAFGRTAWEKPQPEPPRWVKKDPAGASALSNSGVGASYYKKMLGCGSACDLAGTADVSEAAKKLHDTFMEAYRKDELHAEAESYSRSSTRRYLATLSDVVDFYGLTISKAPGFAPEPDFEHFTLSGNLFNINPAARKIAEGLAETLRNSTVQIGL